MDDDRPKISKNKKRVKNSISKKKAEIKKLKKLEKVADGKNAVLDTDDINVTPAAKELALEQEYIWIPDYDPDLSDADNILKMETDPGVQARFLASDEREVMFAGGRGSGKSDCLLLDPLRFVHNNSFRGVIIRRTMDELREIIMRAQTMYPKAVPGTKFHKMEKRFTFPSGAIIEFGFCDNIQDAQRYVGQQFTWLGIDEISQYKSPEILDKIGGSMRTTDPELPIQIRLTTNPTGVGRAWLKERFVDRADDEEVIEDKYWVPELDKYAVITKKWFNSTVFDNKLLLKNNPDYVAYLMSLPEPLRSQWLQGSWEAAEGLAFPEFNKEVHVVKPFDLNPDWPRFRACDWGYAKTSLAVCLWFAIDFDNNVYVYREYATNQTNPDVFAREILHREYGEKIRYGVLDSSTWAQRGDVSGSIADAMIHEGCQWSPADRRAGTRAANKLLIHQYLTLDENTAMPQLLVFDTCKQLIKEMTHLPLDDKNPEDVDTDAEDHAYDALRYGLASRPVSAIGPNPTSRFASPTPIQVGMTTFLN